MKTVMLVEDEILVRVGIKSIVDWEEHGYSVIGEASNGSEALEKIRARVPDIVMTDLVMDTMDGFELIQTLREEYPSIRIVVLSCHNDFHHVKEAMRLGANDYIFKLTIKPDELIKTLDSVRGDAREPAPQAAAAADRVVHQNMDAIKSKLLRAAIERSYVSAEACAGDFRQLRVRVDLERPYLLVCISADEFYLASVNSKIKERELLKFSMLNFISEAFDRVEAAEVFNDEGGDCLVIVQTDQTDQTDETDETNPANQTEQADRAGPVDRVDRVGRGQPEEAVASTFGMLREYMQRYLGIGISGGVSRRHRGVKEAGDAYSEAMQALGARFYSGGGKLYFYRDNPSLSASGHIDLPDDLDCAELNHWLESMESERVLTFVDRYFDFLETCHHASRHRVRNRLFELLVPFLTAARKRGIDLDAMTGEGNFPPQQVIAKYESLQLIRAWFRQFAERFMAMCRQKGQTRSREEIVKVKQYVKDHFHQSDLNVSSAAALVHMSESYFSHLFKKETGSSFVDYVNAMRIDKAKELLLQTDMKIYEIADKVGVDNANYFSMLFKKLTGLSPVEYRK